MKIGFCGTMSVGKTTLVNALKELPEFKNYHFRTERSKYLMEMGIPLNTDSTFKGQLVFASERAAELMQENIITDRTVIDVMAFSELSTSMEDYEKFHLNAALYHLIKEYDILFYVSPEGVEIEDNGVRETNANYRMAIDKEIKSIVGMYRRNTPTLKGTVEERIKQVKSIVAQYV
jgi:nicotinamide riboside kinase